MSNKKRLPLSRKLKTLNKKQKVGAFLSVLIAVFCMYGIYNIEFSIETEPQVVFEEAIEAYFFADDLDVKLLRSEQKGKNLFVLFQRLGYKGHYGIAHLERGLLGKYRFISAKLSDWPLYHYQMSRKKDWLLVYGIYDISQVSSYAIYPAKDDADDPIYAGRAEKAPFLRLIELNDPAPYAGIDSIHYYGVNGERLDLMALWEEAPVPDQARTPSVGSAELGLVYFYLGLVFFVGLVMVRYFISA